MTRGAGLLLAASLAMTCVAAASCAPRAGEPAVPSPAGPVRSTPAVGPALDGSVRPIATMSELMVRVLYPYSDNIFYIATRTPTDDAGWSRLDLETLLLAESANLLMTPPRSLGERWDSDARLLLDVAEDALELVRRRDVAGLEALNDPLYESCTTCHEHFRPGYGRR